jgi:hypothetical protein
MKNVRILTTIMIQGYDMIESGTSCTLVVHVQGQETSSAHLGLILL